MGQKSLKEGVVRPQKAADNRKTGKRNGGGGVKLENKCKKNTAVFQKPNYKKYKQKEAPLQRTLWKTEKKSEEDHVEINKNH